MNILRSNTGNSEEMGRMFDPFECEEDEEEEDFRDYGDDRSGGDGGVSGRKSGQGRRRVDSTPSLLTELVYSAGTDAGAGAGAGAGASNKVTLPPMTSLQRYPARTGTEMMGAVVIEGSASRDLRAASQGGRVLPGEFFHTTSAPTQQQGQESAVVELSTSFLLGAESSDDGNDLDALSGKGDDDTHYEEDKEAKDNFQIFSDDEDKEIHL